MRILHLDSSITGDQSVSRQLTARIVENLGRSAPATTSYRDLAKDPLPHFTFTPEAKAAHAASLEEFPSQLKAWRVIVASSRGGTYSNGAMADFDFQEAYLRTVFRFLGVTDVAFVRAEGVATGTEAKQRAIERALAHADSFGVRQAVAA